jgi:hypothetical protein
MSSGIPAISTESTPSLLRGFVELDPTENRLLSHRLRPGRERSAQIPS